MSTVISPSKKIRPKNYAHRLAAPASAVAMFQHPPDSVFVVDTQNEALNRELLSLTHSPLAVLSWHEHAHREFPRPALHRPSVSTRPAQS